MRHSTTEIAVDMVALIDQVSGSIQKFISGYPRHHTRHEATGHHGVVPRCRLSKVHDASKLFEHEPFPPQSPHARFKALEHAGLTVYAGTRKRVTAVLTQGVQARLWRRHRAPSSTTPRATTPGIGISVLPCRPGATAPLAEPALRRSDSVSVQVYSGGNTRRRL